jgi:arylsulfatase A-like enzyme
MMAGMTHALLAALLAAAPEAPPRGIVLVTIDTLRADRVGAYGYARPTSPFLDRLARQGVLFEQAFASAAHTSPAHASLFTGLHPSQHGVRSNGQGFPDRGAEGYPTLAEVLAGAGYATAAVSAVNFLRPITRGFSFQDFGGEARGYRTADRTVDRAIDWLTTQRGPDRFFLWLHLYDPHLPHRAPEALGRELAFATPQAAESWANEVLATRPRVQGVYPSSVALAARHAAYDAEVRFADRELERLFEALRGAGLLEDLIFIATSDHGEGLGDHAYDGHGPFLYDEVVRVPLILWRGGRYAGLRVRALVRHVDLLPTLAEWTGARLQMGSFSLQGRSLLPALRAPSLPLSPALAFAQRRPPGPKLRHYEKGEVFALRDLDFKYIVRTGSRDEMYDLRSDPLEEKNLAGQATALVRSLEQRARQTFAEASREGARAKARPPSRESEEELRALGYVK